MVEARQTTLQQILPCPYRRPQSHILRVFLSNPFRDLPYFRLFLLTGFLRGAPLSLSTQSKKSRLRRNSRWRDPMRSKASCLRDVSVSKRTTTLQKRQKLLSSRSLSRAFSSRRRTSSSSQARAANSKRLRLIRLIQRSNPILRCQSFKISMQVAPRSYCSLRPQYRPRVAHVESSRAPQNLTAETRVSRRRTYVSLATCERLSHLRLNKKCARSLPPRAGTVVAHPASSR